MNTLNMIKDFNKEKPNFIERKLIWKSVRLFPLSDFGEATKLFMEKLSETHCNGGVQIHKYKIERNEHFEWFAERNLLGEISFVKNIITHADLTNYRKDLEIKIDKLTFRKFSEVRRYWGDSDIFTLPGELARVLAQGGAYKKTHPYLAWELAKNFIEEAYQNRFDEVISFDTEIIPVSEWFYNVAWDYSKILFDKRNYEIMFIDITDTD